MPDLPTPETLLALLSDGAPRSIRTIENEFREAPIDERIKIGKLLFDLLDHGGFVADPGQVNIFEITTAGRARLMQFRTGRTVKAQQTAQAIDRNAETAGQLRRSERVTKESSRQGDLFG